MPFNNVAPIPNFSMGLFSSAVYFLSLFSFIPMMKKIGSYHGKFVWNILIFIVFFTLVNILNKCGYNTPVFPFSMFMCFILMLFLLVHSLIDSKALSYCMYGMAFGGILMSIFFALGIGIEIGEDLRLVMFGENANALGIYMGLSSIIILDDFILNDELQLKKFRFVFIVAFIPIVGLLFATGSRTAFLIFALSIFAIIGFYPTKSAFGKIAFFILGIACCAYAFNKLVDSDSILIERLTTTVEEGNSSGRDKITESLIPYVFESPLWGYGQTGYVKVAQKALGKVSVFGNVVYGYSPHNVIMELLMYTGIIGLVLWIKFWWEIGKESWILFRKQRLLMAGLMCIPMLACILSGQLLTAKWAYILYAYILSEYYYFRYPLQKI
ncbi:MAG: O-antigen ligase family protein [Candidatus Aphodosoma sp.]